MQNVSWTWHYKMFQDIWSDNERQWTVNCGQIMNDDGQSTVIRHDTVMLICRTGRSVQCELRPHIDQWPFNGHTETAQQWTVIQQYDVHWLVHWPLMGGLLHLVQQRVAWADCGATQSPSRCTKCNSPPINSQCTIFISFIRRRRSVMGEVVSFQVVLDVALLIDSHICCQLAPVFTIIQVMQALYMLCQFCVRFISYSNKASGSSWHAIHCTVWRLTSHKIKPLSL